MIEDVVMKKRNEFIDEIGEYPKYLILDKNSEKILLQELNEYRGKTILQKENLYLEEFMGMLIITTEKPNTIEVY